MLHTLPINECHTYAERSSHIFKGYSLIRLKELRVEYHSEFPCQIFPMALKVLVILEFIEYVNYIKYKEIPRIPNLMKRVL
jgi:hypothetical protein